MIKRQGNGFLARMLKQGHKAFRPQSSVHSLLGLSGSDSVLRSMPTPLTGFHYAMFPMEAGWHPAQTAGPVGAPAGGSAGLGGSSYSDSASVSAERPLSQPSGTDATQRASDTGRNQASPIGTAAPPPSARPLHTPQARALPLEKASATAGDPVSTAADGPSMQTQPAPGGPAYVARKNVWQQQSLHGTPGNNPQTESRPGRAITPISDDEISNATENAGVEGRSGQESRVMAPSQSGDEPRRWIRRSRQAGLTVKTPESSAHPAGDPKTVARSAEEHSGEGEIGARQEGSGSHQPATPLSLDEQWAANFSRSFSGLNPAQQAAFKRMIQSDGLPFMLHKQTYSTGHEQTSQEPHAGTQSKPPLIRKAKPVTRVRRPSSSSQPTAFWERSYLTRFQGRWFK